MAIIELVKADHLYGKYCMLIERQGPVTEGICNHSLYVIVILW